MRVNNLSDADHHEHGAISIPLRVNQTSHLSGVGKLVPEFYGKKNHSLQSSWERCNPAILVLQRESAQPPF